jgi:hypothetical protein
LALAARVEPTTLGYQAATAQTQCSAVSPQQAEAVAVVATAAAISLAKTVDQVVVVQQAKQVALELPVKATTAASITTVKKQAVAAAVPVALVATAATPLAERKVQVAHLPSLVHQ